MLKLSEVIKTALNEVGCEELPSGCDDISVDHTFIENDVINGNTEPTVSKRTLSNIRIIVSIETGTTTVIEGRCKVFNIEIIKEI